MPPLTHLADRAATGGGRSGHEASDGYLEARGLGTSSAGPQIPCLEGPRPARSARDRQECPHPAISAWAGPELHEVGAGSEHPTALEVPYARLMDLAGYVPADLMPARPTAPEGDPLFAELSEAEWRAVRAFVEHLISTRGGTPALPTP